MFNGYQNVEAVKRTNEEFKGIENPMDLYNVLLKCWCEDTCAPRLRHKWSEDNVTTGQCSVTAFLAQDIFGGEVRGIKTESGIHCYNCVNGHIFDLTSEQFGEKAADLVYDASSDPVQSRVSENHFGKEEKFRRYQHLNKMVMNQIV